MPILIGGYLSRPATIFLRTLCKLIDARRGRAAGDAVSKYAQSPYAGQPGGIETISGLVFRGLERGRGARESAGHWRFSQALGHDRSSASQCSWLATVCHCFFGGRHIFYWRRCVNTEPRLKQTESHGRRSFKRRSKIVAQLAPDLPSRKSPEATNRRSGLPRKPSSIASSRRFVKSRGRTYASLLHVVLRVTGPTQEGSQNILIIQLEIGHRR